MEKERLAEYLEQYHMGALNAATSRELELTFGIKGIQVRHMVNALRRDGVPIASNGSGYFYAATDQERIPHRPACRWMGVIRPEQFHVLDWRQEGPAGVDRPAVPPLL